MGNLRKATDVPLSTVMTSHHLPIPTSHRCTERHGDSLRCGTVEDCLWRLNAEDLSYERIEERQAVELIALASQSHNDMPRIRY